MAQGKVLTRAYRYVPQENIWDMRWIPEDDVIGEYPFNYDERKSAMDIAQQVANEIVGKLKSQYEGLGVDPNPQVAALWGGDIVGAEVYYQSLTGMMKISARMRIQ